MGGGGGGMLNQHWRTGVWQGAQLSVKKAGQGTKAESRGWVTSQPTKAEAWMTTKLSLVGLRAVLKTERPHLGGGGADQTELQG
jgi:hypothetical protein